MSEWDVLTLKQGVPYRLAERVSLKDRRAMGADSGEIIHQQFIMAM